MESRRWRSVGQGELASKDKGGLIYKVSSQRVHVQSDDSGSMLPRRGAKRLKRRQGGKGVMGRMWRTQALACRRKASPARGQRVSTPFVVCPPLWHSPRR